MREIKPVNNNGSIQLKFSFGGKRYCLNPVPGGDYSNIWDFSTARAIATQIQNDIRAGYFDPTLQRYKLVPVTPTPTPTKPKPEPKLKTLLPLWDEWVNTLDISPATKADRYEMIRRTIVKAKPAIADVSWLTLAAIAPATFNKRLSYVKSCFNWAVKEGRVNDNPFDKVKSRKASVGQVKPFSVDEMAKIVTGFETQAPHYAPFVRFLFLTGARLSEAIGLLWEHIDFNRQELVIMESLSKTGQAMVTQGSGKPPRLALLDT